MRKIVLAMLLSMTLPTLAGGWNYYVLNEEGEWEKVSRYQLDLALPKPAEAGAATGEARRVMILYNPRADRARTRNARNWLRQVDPGLVEVVK